MAEDSLGPLLGRLQRTVLRFGDERDDRAAIDFGEGATGELTWGDLRRLKRLLRWAERADEGAMVRRLEWGTVSAGNGATGWPLWTLAVRRLPISTSARRVAMSRIHDHRPSVSPLVGPGDAGP